MHIEYGKYTERMLVWLTEWWMGNDRRKWGKAKWWKHKREIYYNPNAHRQMEGKGHSSTCDIDTFVSLPQNICIWPDVDGIPCKHPHITYKLDIAYCQTVHLFMLFMLMNAVPLRENGRNEQTTNSHGNGDKNPHSIWISNLLHADIPLQTLWRGQPKAEVKHRPIASMHLMNVDFEVNREKKQKNQHQNHQPKWNECKTGNDRRQSGLLIVRNKMWEMRWFSRFKDNDKVTHSWMLEDIFSVRLSLAAKWERMRQ